MVGWACQLQLHEIKCKNVSWVRCNVCAQWFWGIFLCRHTKANHHFLPFSLIAMQIGVWLVYIVSAIQWPVVSSQCLKRLLFLYESVFFTIVYWCISYCFVYFVATCSSFDGGASLALYALHFDWTHFTIADYLCQLNKKANRNKQESEGEAEREGERENKNTRKHNQFTRSNQINNTWAEKIQTENNKRLAPKQAKRTQLVTPLGKQQIALELEWSVFKLVCYLLMKAECILKMKKDEEREIKEERER